MTSDRYLRCLLLSTHSVDATGLATTTSRIRHFTALTGGKDLAIVLLLDPPKTHDKVDGKDLSTIATSDDDDDDDDESTGLIAYTRLQAELLALPESSGVPVLPLATLEKLPDMLQKHVAAICRPKARASTANEVTPFELLRQCTLEPPMSESTAYFITDTFTDLCELATACTGVPVTSVETPLSNRRSMRELGMDSTPEGRALCTDVISEQYGNMHLERKLQKLYEFDEHAAKRIAAFWSEEWALN